jgi:hypothetical protein
MHNKSHHPTTISGGVGDDAESFALIVVDVLGVRQRMKKLVQRVPFPFCVARFVVGEEGVYLIRFALLIEGHRLYILMRSAS